jgi:hypothetical protein
MAVLAACCFDRLLIRRDGSLLMMVAGHGPQLRGMQCAQALYKVQQLLLRLPLCTLSSSAGVMCSAVLCRCLAEKLADPDFGQKCRDEVMKKLLRR